MPVRKKLVKKNTEFHEMEKIEKKMQNLKNIDEDIPINIFDIEFETNNLNYLEGDRNIIFFILFNNDLEMVKRTINKLKYNKQHHFIINICPDIKPDIKKDLIEFYKNDIVVSICYCGYIKYLSSTDLKIIYSIKNYLVNINNWHFFITLGQNDYSLFNGEILNQKIGDKSWCLIEKKYDKKSLLEYKGLLDRFINGMFPTREKIHKFKRDLWIFNSIPNIMIAKSFPLSSGGIFTRDTVEYLVNDNKCKIIYNFCLFMSAASVEHFWQTCYTLPYFENKILNKHSVYMSWDKGRQGKIPGTSNTFLTIEQLDIIKEEYMKGTIFVRKFDSEKEKNILDAIDKL